MSARRPSLEELHTALSDLVKLYQFRSRDEKLYYGVTVAQAYCMRALWLHGPLTMGRLARELTLRVSTMTGVVDQLVETGFVRRSSDAEDRRRYRVRLTPLGRRTYERANAEFLERLGDVTEGLSARELRTVHRFLRDVAAMIVGWRDVRSPSARAQGGAADA